MNTSIIITAIICVTVLIIVGIVEYVEYKLKNNDVIREIKSELKSISTELEINNRWYGVLSGAFDDIVEAIQELKKENSNVTE